MSRLLNKPLKIFAVYAVIILVCSIPVYYFIVDSIWLDELDEHNQIVREQTQDGFNKLHLDKEALGKSVDLWNKMQVGLVLIPTNRITTDSTFTVVRESFYKGEKEVERFRGLVSSIQINGQNYKITIETNVEETNETVLAIALITCVFIALLILGFILLNKRLSKKVWAPFSNTLDRLKDFDLNAASQIDFEKTDITEFTELNMALERLISANVQSFNQQKEFVQNASHELQTPLALLKSKIDLLIQDAQLTVKQREVIESLAASVSRVTRINRNLLFLVGIENKTFVDQEIVLNDRVAELFSNISELYAGSHKINMDLGSPLSIKANDGLLDVLITNLLSNAFRHSEQDAIIGVQIQGRSLVVRNSGDEALNEAALFKRFQAVSSSKQGTGLGLAIIKEICNKYGWQISYRFDGAQHIFRLDF